MTWLLVVIALVALDDMFRSGGDEPVRPEPVDRDAEIEAWRIRAKI